MKKRMKTGLFSIVSKIRLLCVLLKVCWLVSARSTACALWGHGAVNLVALGRRSAARVQLLEQEENPSAQGFSLSESPVFGQW